MVDYLIFGALASGTSDVQSRDANPYPTGSGLCNACVNLNLVVSLLGPLSSDASCSVNVDGKLCIFTTVDRGMMPPLSLCLPLCVCYLHHYCNSAHLCMDRLYGRPLGTCHLGFSSGVLVMKIEFLFLE